MDDNRKQAVVPPLSPTLPLPPPRAPEVVGAVSIFPSDPIGVSHGAGTEPTPQSLALTPHLIHANDRSVATLSPDILGFESFVPELRGLRPEALLRALSERYREDPSVSNSLLLQHAINRLTNTGPVGEHLRKEIDKAIEVLHHAPSRRDEGANADDIFYWAYADASFRGASMFGDLPSGWIYWRTPYVGDAMNDVISSLTVTVTSNEVGGNVALFQDAGFVGKYQNYGVTVPPGINGYVQEDVSFVGDDFNDIASSILAIRRFASETRPVSISGLIKPGDITAIVNQFSGISPAGDATITWDLWPTGPTSSHDWHPDDPAKRFIYVLVPITVHTPAPFPDTFAQIRYWVYLYVDDSGRIQGFTEYWGYYVSSCCFLTSCITNDIANALAARIPGTIGQVNALVANAVAVANTGGPYRFTYFLPGKGQFTGSTWDDVTVVAVKR